MRKLAVIFIMFSIAFYSCNNGGNKTSSNEEQTVEINPSNVVLIDMDVSGMTCTGCENTIKSGVSELAGVVEVDASHTESKTFVKVDTSLTSPEEIARMISSKGYEVTASAIYDAKELKEE